jgi:hypothetical protein
MQKNVEWLRHCTEQYRSTTNNIYKTIEDFEEVAKLGQGFLLADPLEEIYMGDGITPRLTFVNKIMSLENKDVIKNCLKSMLIVSPGIIVTCPDLAES